MLMKALGAGSVLAAIAIVLLVNLTSPTDAGPLGVLALLVSIYVLSLGVATLVIWCWRKSRRRNLHHVLRHSGIVAFAPIIWIFASSLVNNMWLGAGLTIVVVTIVYILVSKK